MRRSHGKSGVHNTKFSHCKHRFLSRLPVKRADFKRHWGYRHGGNDGVGRFQRGGRFKEVSAIVCRSSRLGGALLRGVWGVMGCKCCREMAVGCLCEGATRVYDMFVARKTLTEAQQAYERWFALRRASKRATNDADRRRNKRDQRWLRQRNVEAERARAVALLTLNAIRSTPRLMRRWTMVCLGTHQRKTKRLKRATKLEKRLKTDAERAVELVPSRFHWEPPFFAHTKDIKKSENTTT